jgi:WD40 repeat protein
VIRAAYVSPGEKYLAFLARAPKSKEIEGRVAVFEIDKTASRYELKQKHDVRQVQQPPQVGAMFSPGAKYFAVDAGKMIRIYDSASGEKRLETTDIDSPNGWLNDETFLRHYSGLMKAYDTPTGKLLYEQKQVYDEYEYTEPSSYSSGGYDPGTTRVAVNDRTHIRVHPAGRMFLTYSNQYVKVFDTRTGELLQELVAPPMDYTKKKPRLSDKTLVSEAGWSYDGRTLYVLGADGRTVSLWWLLDS